MRNACGDAVVHEGHGQRNYERRELETGNEYAVEPAAQQAGDHRNGHDEYGRQSQILHQQAGNDRRQRADRPNRQVHAADHRHHQLRSGDKAVARHSSGKIKQVV